MERREFLKRLASFSAVAGSTALWVAGRDGKRYLNAYVDYPDGYDGGYHDGYGDGYGDYDNYWDGYDDYWDN